MLAQNVEAISRTPQGMILIPYSQGQEKHWINARSHETIAIRRVLCYGMKTSPPLSGRGDWFGFLETYTA